MDRRETGRKRVNRTPRAAERLDYRLRPRAEGGGGGNAATGGGGGILRDAGEGGTRAEGGEGGGTLAEAD
jgi:hypothetical protein